MRGSFVAVLVVAFVVINVVHACGPVEFAPVCHGHAWYVNVTGNDGNPGTPASPLKSVAAAVQRAASGDSIVVSSGTYQQASAPVSLGSTVCICGEGPDKPVLKGPAAGGTQMFVITSSVGQLLLHNIILDGTDANAGITTQFTGPSPICRSPPPSSDARRTPSIHHDIAHTDHYIDNKAPPHHKWGTRGSTEDALKMRSFFLPLSVRSPQTAAVILLDSVFRGFQGPRSNALGALNMAAAEGNSTSLYMRGCHLYDNVLPTAAGAGILLSNVDATIESSVFRDSTAACAAGVFAGGSSSLTMTNVTFLRLVSNSNGGGVMLAGTAKASITNSSFTACQAKSGDGGGVLVDDNSAAVITSSRFGQNVVSNYGAGVAARGSQLGPGFSLVLQHCVFTGNSADQGGGVSCAAWRNVSIVNCTLTDNYASGFGGAVMNHQYDEVKKHNPPSFVLLLRSTLVDNWASDGAAHVYGDGVSTVTVFEDCLVEGGHTPGNGGVFYGTASTTAFSIRTTVSDTVGFAGAWYTLSGQLTLRNSTVRNVRASSGGCISGLGQGVNVLVERCSFVDNHAGQMGGVLNLPQGRLAVYDSFFARNVAVEGGGVLSVALTGTTLQGTIERCTFVNNSAGISGGAIDIDSLSTLTVVDSVFRNNLCGASGGVIVVLAGTLMLTNCHFMGNRVTTTNFFAAVRGGSINLNKGSTGIFNNITVVGRGIIDPDAAGGGCIAVLGASVLNISRSELHNCRARLTGGALLGQGESKVVANQLTVTSSHAHAGGGIFMSGSSQLTLRNSTIASNVATNGGGVGCSTCFLLVENTRVEFNQAQLLGEGAGIYITDCPTAAYPLPHDCHLPQDPGGFEMCNNTFIGNNAFDGAGGAVFMGFDCLLPFVKGISSSVVCPHCSFADNHAVFGNSVASNPVGIIGLSKIPLKAAAGEAFEVRGQVVDQFNNHIRGQFCQSTQVTLAVDNGTLNNQTIAPGYLVATGNLFDFELPFSSITFPNTQTGVVEFGTVAIVGAPEFVYYLELRVHFEGRTIFSLARPVRIEQCGPGFASVPGHPCSPCPSGFFNLVGAGRGCVPCPEGAVCLGGDRVFTGRDYWRDPAVPAQLIADEKAFFRCQRPGMCCPSGLCDPVLNYTTATHDSSQLLEVGSKCGSKREGTLCGRCKGGYTTVNGSCVRCKYVYWGMLVAAFLFVLSSLVFVATRHPSGAGLTSSTVLFLQSAALLLTDDGKSRAFMQLYLVNLFDVASVFNLPCTLPLSAFEVLPAVLISCGALLVMVPLVLCIFWACCGHSGRRAVTHRKPFRTYADAQQQDESDVGLKHFSGHSSDDEKSAVAPRKASINDALFESTDTDIRMATASSSSSSSTHSFWCGAVCCPVFRDTPPKDAASTSRWEPMRGAAAATWHGLLVAVHFLYVPVTRTALALVACREVHGRNVLMVAPTVTCWGETHAGWGAVAIVLLAVLTAGLPLSICYTLIQERRMGYFALNTRLGYLFLHFRPPAWVWMVLSWFLPIVLVVLELYELDALRRTMWSIGVLTFFVLVYSLARPLVSLREHKTVIAQTVALAVLALLQVARNTLLSQSVARAGGSDLGAGTFVILSSSTTKVEGATRQCADQPWVSQLQAAVVIAGISIVVWLSSWCMAPRRTLYRCLRFSRRGRAMDPRAQ